MLCCVRSILLIVLDRAPLFLFVCTPQASTAGQCTRTSPFAAYMYDVLDMVVCCVIVNNAVGA